MMGDSDAEAVRLSSRELQQQAVKGAGWTMIHTMVSVPIAFLVNVLLARVLEPGGYGRLAFLTTLIVIAGNVLALGLTPAMIQFGAKAHAAGRADEVRRILSSSQGFRLLVVAPLLTLLVLLLIDVPVALLAVAVAFGVWVPAALDGAPIALIIENKTATGAKIAMITNLVVQAGVVVAVLGLGTADAVWATRTVLTAVGIALAVVAIRRAYRRAVLRPRLPRNFPPGFWKFAVPTGAAGIVTELVMSRSEVLILEWLSTPTAVGLFALAFGVSGHIFAPAQALTGPLIPAVTGLREVGPENVATAFARTIRASATVVGILVATALPALTLLIPTLYGREFASAAPAMLALGITGGVTVAAGPLTAFVLARLSGRFILAASLAALVVDVLLALALIPLLGMWGAVIASALAALTRMAMLFVSEVRALNMAPGYAATTLLPAVFGGGASYIAWLGASMVSAPDLVRAVLAAVIALILVIGALRLTRTGLTPQDRDAILRAVPHRLQSTARRTLRILVTSP